MASTDHALNTRFRFNLTGQRGLTLRLQKVPLSPVTLGTTQLYPKMGKADINIPSNKLTYDPVTFDFVVSEDYHEYLDVLDWMDRAVSTDGTRDIIERGELELLDSQYNPVVRFHYEGIWPSEVGELTYELDNDAVVLKCTVMCYYDEIKRERVNV